MSFQSFHELSILSWALNPSMSSQSFHELTIFPWALNLSMSSIFMTLYHSVHIRRTNQHIMRITDESLPQTALTWTLQGKGSTGCPQRDTEMHSRENAGKQWTNMGDNLQDSEGLTKVEIFYKKLPPSVWRHKVQRARRMRESKQLCVLC